MKTKGRLLLQEIVKKVANEYKEKNYNELLEICNDSHIFSRTFDSKQYLFEIESRKLDNNEVNVCVLGHTTRLFSKGYAIYFIKNISNEILDKIKPF